MRMEQLKCLVDVAQTKSMSKTAERLFISPQAVSQSIKQLEKELDTELLVRTSMGVTLTKVGESIVAHAQNMLQEEEIMNQIVAESRQRIQQDNTFPIRICSTTSLTNIVLPDVIAKFVYVDVNIIPRIHMVDRLQDVFEQVQKRECDIGLLTYNEQELFRKFAPYQNDLDMNLLARDELVVVMDRRLHQPGQEFLSEEERRNHFRTMYCVLPIDEMEQYSNDVHVIRSNDAEFHRAMMKKVATYVTMPKLAYQYFFSNKSYLALPLKEAPTPLLHAAVYRKDAPENIQRFVSMIRVEMM